MVGLSGLGRPSRWGGETALEVLGLGCSGDLWANLASFSSSDSILMAFLGPSVWQDFLFCGMTVSETSCVVGSYRARSRASRGPGVVGRGPDLGGRGLRYPHLPPLLLLPLCSLPCRSCLSPRRQLPRPPRTLWPCLQIANLYLPGSGSCLEGDCLTGQLGARQRTEKVLSKDWLVFHPALLLPPGGIRPLRK